ncbi:CooT family nickel-binding protein [Methanocella conradii]|uniref:CooT family nickel-binding protein n=1 Tax=Methanocella conradii TaxID=1175444 RepID=UPI0024B3408B|nr:CooT family nickel-binding protein [Methanocella conradii]MDI6896275.1 CooT family nickel-binding protein [Methanocella conradii]
MCEFTVFLENDGNREKIARNVVKAKLKDGFITLMDVGGNLTKVEKASIQTVDTLMQELILKKEL